MRAIETHHLSMSQVDLQPSRRRPSCSCRVETQFLKETTFGSFCHMGPDVGSSTTLVDFGERRSWPGQPCAQHVGCLVGCGN